MLFCYHRFFVPVLPSGWFETWAYAVDRYRLFRREIDLVYEQHRSRTDRTYRSKESKEIRPCSDRLIDNSLLYKDVRR